MGGGQSRSVFCGRGKAEYFPPDDIKQINLGQADWGHLGTQQISATATFQQSRPEPAQWLHASWTTGDQQFPVDSTSGHERQIEVRLDESLLCHAFGTQLGPGYHQLVGSEQMPKQAAGPWTVSSPAIGEGL